MLEPKIRVCFTENCSKLNIYDTTGEVSVDNTGGYGAPNNVPVDIETATITYVTPGGSATTIDVVANVNAQTTLVNEFLIATIDLTALDGEYSFTYNLSTDIVGEIAAGSYTVSLAVFSLCNARCCVDKLWSKVAQNIINNEDCNCSGDPDSYLNKAYIAESLFKAIKYGIACNNSIAKNEILKKLQRICKLEKCNCN